MAKRKKKSKVPPPCGVLYRRCSSVFGVPYIAAVDLHDAMRIADIKDEKTFTNRFALVRPESLKRGVYLLTEQENAPVPTYRKPRKRKSDDPPTAGVVSPQPTT